MPDLRDTDASRRSPPHEENALTIVTKGRGRVAGPARAQYSIVIQADGPRIIYEVVEDASTARREEIRPPGLAASGKRR